MADGRRSTAPLCVLPDNRVYIARLVILAPFLLVGMVLFFFRLVAGGRDSGGASGGGALVATVAGLGLPLLYVAGLIALRLVNARILLEDGRLTVRNAWRWPVFAVPVDDVTGLHPVDVKVGTDQVRPGRVVVTSRSARPFVLDSRMWQAADYDRLVRRLGVPVGGHESIWWGPLKAAYPGVRMPWLQVHTGVVLTVGTIGTLAYIFVIVNLAFRI
ncbi:hypothetical protein R8Z50_14965 [Longispora sp. K20-0274]|uniref:hypothetical protein n=1 Tax=Longispora sp. K20-0274 TaxID=3088255 RepID=UPI003999642B